MSDSDTESTVLQHSRNENRPPKRPRHRPAFQGAFDTDPCKVPKHLRMRYWNSWEEMKLVELWRLHRDEVTTLQKNIPIFRTIYDGMRGYGFHVNSQECRRKINTMKNKFIAQRRRVENGEARITSSAEWRLFPLIQCLLAPKQKNQILSHQQIILNQLFTKIPQDALAPYMPATQSAITPPSSSAYGPTGVRHYRRHDAAVTIAGTAALHTQRFQPYARHPRLPLDGLHFVLKNHFTAERLAHLRVDNKLLAEQRDNAAKQLSIEEREFKILETFLMQWHRKQECLLRHLQSAEGNGIG